MKKINLIKKLFIVLILIQFLSSCAVTGKLWDARAGGDTISSFFLDKDKKRVVLIGDERDENGNDHYSLTDKEGKIFKVFELGVKYGKGTSVMLYNVYARGSKVYGKSMEIGFWLRDNLLEQEKNIIYQDDDFKIANKGKSSYIIFHPLKIGIITRYPSSKEPFKNICSKTNNNPNCSPIIKLDRVWQGVIWNEYTASETLLRIIITPFAIAGDILLSPLYGLAYIVSAH